jgi:asparagine synthase (glutamine-hydrolysing)
MCGIGGIFDPTYQRGNDNLSSALSAMVNILHHRGPDDKGIWVSQEAVIGLTHARLSILDLSPAGHQPMTSKNKRYVISFNGEIYNFLELKQELVLFGHKFQGSSDTEVMLSAFEEWGLSAALPHFTGMFAFALWDCKEKILHLVRDRVGKKPLYYTLQARGIYFASEIKALLAVPDLSFDLDPVSLDQFLSFGSIHGMRTIFTQVQELQPGYRMEVDSSLNCRSIRYWYPHWDLANNFQTHDLQANNLQAGNLHLEEALERTEQLLSQAIFRRLRADVPVGAFLSGGIDSGLVVAMAAQELSRPLITLSIGFKNGQFDERPLARLVARRYHTDHRELVVDPDIVELLPRIVQSYDEPFADSSAIPSYCVAELARQHVKVVLNGDGGDELFAGYRRYIAARLWNQFKFLTVPQLNRFWIWMDTFLPQPSTFRTPYAFARRLLRGITKTEASRYHAWCADGFTLEEKQHLYRNPLPLDHGIEEINERLQALGEMDTLHKYLALDFSGVLPDDLLVKMDIATMAHGLEARSPFLDHHMVEWAQALPNNLLLPGRVTKPLLRRLAKKYLPDEVVTAPKRGFEVPLHQWLQDDLREMSRDLLLQNSGLLNDLFTRSYREDLIFGRKFLDPARWARQVWFLLILALWDQHVWKNRPYTYRTYVR